MRKISLLAAAVAMTASAAHADIQIGKGLTVGGYLDATYKNVSSDVAGADSAGFNAANGEVDFMMDFSKGLTARVDLDATSTPSTVTNTTNGVSLEQIRVDYAFGQSKLTVGKFDTFIGLEGLESPDLYQITNSLSFDTEPTQHTGVSYAYDAGKWNLAVALVNDIFAVDNGNLAGDKKELSYAAHVGIKPVDSLSFNINYAIDNKTTAGVSADTDLWTIDGSYSNHGWTLGAEYVSKNIDKGNEQDAWMLMVNYMFTEQFGLTGRYSTEETDSVAGTKVSDKSEYTLAASYAVTPNWSALVEYRMDKNDLTANSDSNTIALETILTF
jgi:hypothetical protein